MKNCNATMQVRDNFKKLKALNIDSTQTHSEEKLNMHMISLNNFKIQLRHITFNVN